MKCNFCEHQAKHHWQLLDIVDGAFKDQWFCEEHHNQFNHDLHGLPVKYLGEQ